MKEGERGKRNSGKTNFKAKVLWHSLPVTDGGTVVVVTLPLRGV